MSDTTATVKATEAEASAHSKEENQQTTVDLSACIEPRDSETPVLSFAVVEHQRNTEDNPKRENTNVLPYLVRRVNSEELLPRPFKTTNQLLCAAYLCTFCCCFFAALATNRAWKAKEKRNAGVLSGAVTDAKRSFFWMKVALGCGILLWIEAVVLIVLFHLGKLD